MEANSLKERIRVLSGAQLKNIAFFSMLLDHVNKALIYPNLDGGALAVISDIFNVLGRIAFPIFAFLLVEGFFKTGNRWRYLATLLGMGIVSEVPFDMFTSGVFYDPSGNNVMFSLAMILVTIWLVDAIKVKMRAFPKALWYLLSLLIVAAMCLVSMSLAVDYEYHAILIGYFFYIFHERPLLALPFNFLAMYKEPWALLGFGLTLTYNGERGKQNKVINYLFYPVHLLILGILRIHFNI